jgi:iron complex outermembrane receptor protein
MSIKALNARFGATIALLGIGGVPAAVYAQDAVSTDTAAFAEEIVVTGSRIRRDGMDAPTPTAVLDVEEFARTAPLTVGDLLQQVPSFRSSVTIGQVYANLRALGANRTLVLVDGRRHVPTFSDGTLDLNVIPTGAIERTEMVTGGASAAWGSDAVAGVVNLRLKTDLEGIEGTAQAGISDYSDAENYFVSVTAGTRFANGRGHLLVAGEYSYDDGIEPLVYGSRPWSGRGVISNAQYATNGLPANLFVTDARPSNFTGGGLITSGPLRGTNFVGGESISQFGYGEVFGDQMIGGTDNQYYNIQGNSPRFPLRRGNALVRVGFDVTDDVNVYALGGFSRSISEGKTNWLVFQGQSADPTCTTTTITSSLGSILVPITNPYLPESIRQQMVESGQTCFAMGKVLLEDGLGNIVTEDGSPSVIDGAIGFEAKLSDSWQLDGYVAYGRGKYQSRRYHNLIMANFRNAIDAVWDGDNIVCRINADANPNNDDPACQPFNLFGVGVASPGAVNYVKGDAKNDQTMKQTAAAVNISGDLFEGWAGVTKVAFGVEYRKESVVGVADPISEARGFQTGNRSGLKGSYDVKEVYGEISVPLLTDVPFVQSLLVDGAARYTDYSSSGGVTTWKVGTSWQMSSDVRLRATLSQDIRAGNLGELYAASTLGTGAIRDPRNGTVASTPTLTGGNAELEPERAKTLTVGLVLNPGFLPALQLAVDYYDIEIDGVIASITAQQVVDNCFERNIELYCRQVDLTNNVITLVRSGFANLNSLSTRGVDIDARYSTDLAGGDFTVRMMANYVDKLALRVPNSAVVTDPVGQFTNPHWTVFGNFSYQKDRWTFALQEKFYQGGKIDNTMVEGAAALNGVNINHVGSTWYTDIYANYDLGNGVEVFARVEDLFNEGVPFPMPFLTGREPNNVGTPAQIFDQTGRFYRLGVRFSF